MFFALTKKRAYAKCVESLLTISDLKNRTMAFDTKKNKRNLPKICIIDDQEIRYTSVLSSEGYKDITVHKDFTNINDYEQYDVILCDIQGVGKEHNEKEQGVAIAKDLHKNYPYKKIFIYTGNTVEDFGKCPEDIRVIPKQTAPLEIANILDNACEYMWNVEKAWEHIEHILHSEGMCNKNIAYVEHLFVTSFLKKRNCFKQKEGFLDVLKENAALIEMVVSIVTGVLSLAL